MALKTKIKKQKGFTLIELLVVISIIGVLAAVAVPKFVDSSASARTAKVQADLLVLDSAIQLYSANNAGAIPAYTKENIGPYLSGGELPKAPKGKYKIGTTTPSLADDAEYVINSDDKAEITINGVKYTAATLR